MANESHAGARSSFSANVLRVGVGVAVVLAALGLGPGQVLAQNACICNGGGGSGGGGGGGGGGGEPATSVSLTSVSTTETNATVEWEFYPPSASTSMVWGPSGSGSPRYTQSPVSISGDWATVKLLYLQPGSTYDYYVTASESGYTSSTSATASFTTQAFTVRTAVRGLGGGVTIQLANISGVVTTASGAAAPEGLGIDAFCTGNAYSEDNGTATDSVGDFSLRLPYPCENSAYGASSNTYTIEVVNDASTVILPYGSYGWNPDWDTPVYHPAQVPGDWNISIVTPLPEYMTFQLPPDVLGPWVPQVLQFSNAPAGMVTISYSQSVTYSNQVCAPFTHGGENGCSSTQWTTQTTYSNGGSAGSLEVLAQYEASGATTFNATDREWTVTSLNEFGSPVHWEFAGPNSPNYIPDQLTPTSNTPGQYLLNGWSNVLIPGPNSLAWSVDSDQSTASGWTFSLDLEVAVPIDDFGSVGLSTELTWSQTTSVTVSNALSFTLHGNGGDACYDVYAVGPSNDAAALILGIYYWNWNTNPQYVDGSPVCVTPS
ncbi:MAG TPA: hypothetical protein VMH38_03845 [Thermoplasmata archaeon]|nr:hypothetical protein [Thermoplasmata archaeon]